MVTIERCIHARLSGANGFPQRPSRWQCEISKGNLRLGLELLEILTDALRVFGLDGGRELLADLVINPLPGARPLGFGDRKRAIEVEMAQVIFLDLSLGDVRGGRARHGQERTEQELTRRVTQLELNLVFDRAGEVQVGDLAILLAMTGQQR